MPRLGEKHQSQRTQCGKLYDDTSLFPIYRLILPSLERERGPYNLKTKNLSALYKRVFCLSKVAFEKVTSNKQTITTGKVDDLAERIYWELRVRLPTTSQLTVLNVNKFLDDVAASHEMSLQKDELFQHFLRKVSAVELKWLTRIVLKDMKLGLMQKKVFEVIHPDAEELYNVSSSLRRVCERFPQVASESSNDLPIEIEIFSHIKPMLLERFRIEQIGKLFTDDGQKYCVQTKFDGERSQLHMKDGKFKYFTRQGYDITTNTCYGEFANSGFLTSNISRLLNRQCHSIILDGELMGWHKERRTFGSKALSYDVKKLTSKSHHQPCFVAYDILMYNDEVLINKPYSARFDYLKFAFKEEEGILMLSSNDTVSNVDQLRKFFNVALEKNDEGIVVKRHDCLYRPNIREKSGCYKIKAEYSDNLVQDLDLIILGGHYGQGRNSGIVSSFLVGIAGEPINKNGMPSEFFSVVSVSSGLSDDNLKSLQKRFKDLWKDKKPIGVVGPKSELPDVWIPPKQSVILKLRASEIVKSQNYPLGYTLRFPRVLQVRDDKNWHDTCAKAEFYNLVKDRGIVQKLTKRKVRRDDIDEVSDEDEPRIRKIKMSPRKVYGTFDHNENDNVMRVSRLFQDKEFVVINGNAELNRKTIVKILREHMAKIVPNPSKDTFCVIVGDPQTLHAQNLIASSKYDVVKVDWLKRATNLKNLAKIQEFYPWELYSTSPLTQQRIDEVYDQFWDSYVNDIDKESLKRVLDKVDEYLQTNDEILNPEKHKLDRLLFEEGISPYSVFRDIDGYFHNRNDIEKYSFKFMSGRPVDEFNLNINYVFVDETITKKELDCYKNQIANGDREKSTFIVSNKWIRDCFKSQKLLSIDNYHV
ncbi:DNA ligase 4-like isoform X3 [Phymastichus coffea]|uniref:DNA ligase 4-like isoform X3 n=1 Tax=Phymastichus coffea TaxID=108790 RepID=UPI00273BAAE6|nr:DNA ligase 4-like isoform X3 [Phymastichus coffea]